MEYGYSSSCFYFISAISEILFWDATFYCRAFLITIFTILFLLQELDSRSCFGVDRTFGVEIIPSAVMKLLLRFYLNNPFAGQLSTFHRVTLFLNLVASSWSSECDTLLLKSVFMSSEKRFLPFFQDASIMIPAVHNCIRL